MDSPCSKISGQEPHTPIVLWHHCNRSYSTHRRCHIQQVKPSRSSQSPAIRHGAAAHAIADNIVISKPIFIQILIVQENEDGASSTTPSQSLSTPSQTSIEAVISHCLDHCSLPIFRISVGYKAFPKRWFHTHHHPHPNKRFDITASSSL